MAVSFWTDCWVGKVHGRPEKLAINTSCTEQGSKRERSEVTVLQLFAIAFVQLRDKKFVL